MSSHLLFGIDLGGTKTEGVILDGDTRDVLFRERVPTEAEQGYDHILHQIEKLVNLMVSHAGGKPEHIGIGTPGARNPQTGLMKNCNTTALNGRPLKEDLENRIGIPLNMANDANCFTLAETRLGVVHEKFPHANVVFGVIMGTGVGGGVVVHNRIIDGHHGIAGEWGHNQLDPEGPPCYCGRNGCVEKIISGPALEAYYESISKTPLPLREIARLSATGSDPAAVQTIDHLCDSFGKAIATVVNILDPDVIVIGGGVGNIDELYTKGVAAVSNYVFNDTFSTPVLKPSLGDSAGVFGAAMLGLRS